MINFFFARENIYVKRRKAKKRKKNMKTRRILYIKCIVVKLKLHT